MYFFSFNCNIVSKNIVCDVGLHGILTILKTLKFLCLEFGLYPLIMIDFGWTRFIDGINVTLDQFSLDSLSSGPIDFRFGYENITMVIN